MTDRLALSLDRVDRAHHSRVGNKGYTLARLRRTGFPVPPGFVVTTDAYRAFVAANGLDEALAEADLEGARQVRMAFREAEMPPEIAAAISRAYRAMGAGPVAVRSSAVAEDGDDASFAGQHETILDVTGEEALLTAVRQCWASLWSERALTYRRARGIETEPAMAVVVQRMVKADRAGVAFTLDPVSGQRDVVVVEAVAGSGERLVGGQAAPHRYVVRRMKDCYALGDGLLDGARLSAIVLLACRVEARAGEPQDVEWAVDSAGRVYLLQARPVTAIPRGVVRWTRDNVGEVAPDPMTPLSWSVLEPLGNGAFGGVLRRLGMGRSPIPFFGRFYGRVYLNQSLFRSVMARFYISQAGWRDLPRLALTGLRALRALWRLPHEGRGAIGAVLAQRRAEENLDLATIPPEGLLARVGTWRGLAARMMEIHLSVTVMAELLYQALDKLLARWGDGTTTAVALTAGLTGIRSAEVGRAVAALAQEVCQDEALRDLVLGMAPQSLPSRLAKTEQGRAIWSRVESFLARHGHGATQEFELAVPRWRDDPMPVLRALQTQVRAMGETAVADPTAARIAATARVEQHMSLPQRWLFRFLLRRAQDFTIARENLKYHFVLAYGRLRDLYLALAAGLVATGRLEDPTDVFFLKADEVGEMVAGGLTPQRARQRILRRRRAWEEQRRMEAPAALDRWHDGSLRAAPPSIEPEEGNGLRLRGLAASPGTYTGRARVILSPDEGADLRPGEVLVVPATSPGWAPLLVAAGALVTEVGGTLSHGAIIAREYGLPAVLDVADATRRIRTGQWVSVDGSSGIVCLAERESNPGIE